MGISATCFCRAMVRAVDSRFMMGRLWVRFPLNPESFFHQSIKKWRENLNRDEAPSKSLIRIPFFNLPIKFEFEPLSRYKSVLNLPKELFLSTSTKIFAYQIYRKNYFRLHVPANFHPTFDESRLAPLASLGLRPRLARFAARINKSLRLR